MFTCTCLGSKVASAITDGADGTNGTDGSSKRRANKKQGEFTCWLCLVTSVAPAFSSA